MYCSTCQWLLRKVKARRGTVDLGQLQHCAHPPLAHSFIIHQHWLRISDSIVMRSRQLPNTPNTAPEPYYNQSLKRNNILSQYFHKYPYNEIILKIQVFSLKSYNMNIFHFLIVLVKCKRGFKSLPLYIKSVQILFNSMLVHPFVYYYC